MQLKVASLFLMALFFGVMVLPNMAFAIDQKELNEILQLHKTYLDTQCTKGAEANFKEADLIGANLYRAAFVNANLRGANLKNAILSETKLRGADLTGANLEAAKLVDTTLETYHFMITYKDKPFFTGKVSYFYPLISINYNLA